jgi:hypothetical protein
MRNTPTPKECRCTTHIAAVLGARRWRCRCGALAEEPFGLCRKCRARAAWRRPHRQARRNAIRRPGGRTRDRARRLVRAARQAFTLATDPAVKRPPATELTADYTHPRAEGPCRPHTTDGGEL